MDHLRNNLSHSILAKAKGTGGSKAFKLSAILILILVNLSIRIGRFLTFNFRYLLRYCVHSGWCQEG
jgi:hypothetical protein